MSYPDYKIKDYTNRIKEINKEHKKEFEEIADQTIKATIIKSLVYLRIKEKSIREAVSEETLLKDPNFKQEIDEYIHELSRDIKRDKFLPFRFDESPNKIAAYLFDKRIPPKDITRKIIYYNIFEILELDKDCDFDPAQVVYDSYIFGNVLTEERKNSFLYGMMYQGPLFNPDFYKNFDKKKAKSLEYLIDLQEEILESFESYKEMKMSISLFK